jgi:hypothetical protein
MTAPRPSLPTALPAPPRTPAGKARPFDVEGNIPRDTDCPLEEAGFELPVPRKEDMLLRAPDAPHAAGRAVTADPCERQQRDAGMALISSVQLGSANRR